MLADFICLNIFLGHVSGSITHGWFFLKLSFVFCMEEIARCCAMLTCATIVQLCGCEKNLELEENFCNKIKNPHSQENENAGAPRGSVFRHSSVHTVSQPYDRGVYHNHNTLITTTHWKGLTGINKNISARPSIYELYNNQNFGHSRYQYSSIKLLAHLINSKSIPLCFRRLLSFPEQISTSISVEHQTPI